MPKPDESLDEALNRLRKARQAKAENRPGIPPIEDAEIPPIQPFGISGQLPIEVFGNTEESASKVQREKPLANTSYRISAKKRFPFRHPDSRKSMTAGLLGDWETVNKVQKKRSAAIQRIDAEEWQINGKVVNRYNMMKFIVEQVAQGKLLSYVAIGTGGRPSLMTVVAWQSQHPDFKIALERAKEIQAIVLADEGLQGVRDAGPGEANLVKVKHDALMRRAALQSEQFREKAVIIPQGDLGRQSEEDLKRALGDLISSNPNLLPQDTLSKLGMSHVTLAPPEDEGVTVINSEESSDAE